MSRNLSLPIVALIMLLQSQVLCAGGGVVMSGNTCTMHIDFYSARFTAYQPDTRGNEEFCENLPDTGTTLFVLDYLHPSLKEVPVDFRIIRDITGQGRFAKLEDVQALGDIEPLTLFYHPPEIRFDGSFKLEYEFLEEGDYIGVVTAGHPSNDQVYAAVFPFHVGSKLPLGKIAIAVLLLVAGGYYLRMKLGKRSIGA